MDKLNVRYEKEQATCRHCGVEFIANVLYVSDNRMFNGECPPCRDARIKAVEDRQKEIAEYNVLRKRRTWRSDCGIPIRYQTKDFSTFETSQGGNVTEIYQACIQYADNFPIEYDDWRKRTGQSYPSLGLFSAGVWGNGKTHLATAIVHRILDRWQGEDIALPVRFISEPDIYDRIQETYSFNNQERQARMSESEIIGQLSAVRLLVIDDLGKQPRKDMDFVRRTLFTIINKRYNALLPVVITTNKDTPALRDYVGNTGDEATLDRIIEMVGGKFKRVTGPSYRRRS